MYLSSEVDKQTFSDSKSVLMTSPDPWQCAWNRGPFGFKSFNICEEELVTWVWNLWFPLYELYWLLTTRRLTANIFSCTPIFLDNDFCKTINLFIIDICACSVYLEEKAPVENKQTSINKNNHVNMESASAPSVLGFHLWPDWRGITHLNQAHQGGVSQKQQAANTQRQGTM